MSSLGRRLSAFAIDFALCACGVLAMRADAFSGLPAMLFAVGLYKLMFDVALGRTIGQSVLGLEVVVDSGVGNQPYQWAMRESRFWLLPGVVLLAQLPLAVMDSGAGEGVILLFILAALSIEVCVLLADIALATSSPRGRTFFDTFSGTSVRRLR